MGTTVPKRRYITTNICVISGHRPGVNEVRQLLTHNTEPDLHSITENLVMIISKISTLYTGVNKKVKVKWSRYRPGVAQSVGTGIVLLFHASGTRRGWVVSSTPRPHFTPGKDTVPILQEAGWATGPVWTGGKSRPHRDSIPDRPARS